MYLHRVPDSKIHGSIRGYGHQGSRKREYRHEQDGVLYRVVHKISWQTGYFFRRQNEGTCPLDKKQRPLTETP